MKPMRRPLAWAALTALVLVTALGTGVYQAHQLAARRAEVQALAQQRHALAEQLQQLAREREQATHLLAAVQQENARLRAAQKLDELLRLRGQVGLLRQELSAPRPGVSPALMSLVRRDPAIRNLLHDAVRNWVQLNSSGLFKEFKLTPAQAETALQLWTDLECKRVEALAGAPPGTLSQAELARLTDHTDAEVYQQLQAVLGETGVARFKQERESWPAGLTVMLVDNQLGANQLSEEQAKHLAEVVKAEPFQLTQGMIDGWDAAFWGAPQDIQNHLSRIEQSNEHILEQANSFLKPEQCAVLGTVLSNGINARLSFAAAYIQKY